MWQEIVVIIIVTLVVAIVVFKALRAIKKPSNPCDNCRGCALKEQLREKTKNCCMANKKSENQDLIS
ncbi:MAG: FeoB-associated Cys-rich membrane protein [Tannerella sp.]|jgi:hypothetical protein|nr:FeoB-associated Cys-rich membrane protein [Tannerella sp.]